MLFDFIEALFSAQVDILGKSAYAITGYHKQQQGKYEEALSYYNKALKNVKKSIDLKTDVDLFYNKALCLIKLRRNKEALEIFDWILTINPQHSLALNAKTQLVKAIWKVK
ncbi:MAG: tetratricopeptide repeat protein [Candidatus Eremiobacterota bacterium]